MARVNIPVLRAAKLALVSKIGTQAVFLGLKNDKLRSIIKQRLISFIKDEMRRDVPVWGEAIQKDKADMLIAMLESAVRNIERGIIGDSSLRKMVDLLLSRILVKEAILDKIRAFEERYGCKPPGFIVLSPYGGCNLACKGCYAASLPSIKLTLPWKIVCRILEEKVNEWGSFFTVISGGEPFLYSSDGFTLLDLFEKFNDQFFLVYTNGTMITKDVARRLAELGNVTPAISVEGFEEETDRRRGKGTYAMILQAFENLREAKVPFGISVTGDRTNADIILSDEFIERYFFEIGATYMWLFQYMPIGRGIDISLLIPPDKRLEMYRRTWYLVREKKLFIADFWNSGTCANGCMAAGSVWGGGYIYIDWCGHITPCAFVPYYRKTIQEIYDAGGTITDAFLDPFFVAFRNWQKSYVNPENMTESNLIAPCPYRDHYCEIKKIIVDYNAMPIDKPSDEAIKSESYHYGMCSYGTTFAGLSQKEWVEFLDGEKS